MWTEKGSCFSLWWWKVFTAVQEFTVVSNYIRKQKTRLQIDDCCFDLWGARLCFALRDHLLFLRMFCYYLFCKNDRSFLVVERLVFEVLYEGDRFVWIYICFVNGNM